MMKGSYIKKKKKIKKISIMQRWKEVILKKKKKRK